MFSVRPSYRSSRFKGLNNIKRMNEWMLCMTSLHILKNKKYLAEPKTLHGSFFTLIQYVTLSFSMIYLDEWILSMILRLKLKKMILQNQKYFIIICSTPSLSMNEWMNAEKISWPSHNALLSMGYLVQVVMWVLSSKAFLEWEIRLSSGN